MRLYGEGGRVDLLRSGARLLGYEEEAPLLPVEETLPREAPEPLPELDLSQLPEARPGGERYFVIAEREVFRPRKGRKVLEPQWLENAKVLDKDHRPEPGTVSLPHPLPLVRASRLMPFLYRLLARGWPGREPDMERVLDAVARAKLVRRVPMKERRAFAPRVCLLLDIQPDTWPYRDDFVRLYRRLLRLRGREVLDVRVLDGRPEARPRWRAVDEGASIPWRMPPLGVPLVILSDLGANRNDPRLQQGWLRFGRALRAAGIRPLVLCPAPAWRHPPALLSCFDVVAWDESAGRLRASLPGETWPLQPRQPLVEKLLALASPCIQVEPALLRALRHLLPGLEADAGLEADVWQHPDVEGDILWYRLSGPEAVARRQAEFARLGREERPLAAKAVDLIRAHHAHLPDSMRLSELWTCELLVPGILSEPLKKEAEDWAANIVKTCRESGGEIPALGAWAWRQLGRYTGLALRGNAKAAGLWAWVHEADLKAGRPVAPPEGLDMAEIPLLLGEAGAVRTVVLVRNGRDLSLSYPQLNTPTRHGVAQMLLAGNSLSVSIRDSRGQTNSFFHSKVQLPLFLARLGPEVERVDLSSAVERLVLEGVRKPEWALSIRQEKGGLVARLEDGTPAIWRSAEGEQPAGWEIGGWRNPGEIRRDRFGLYAEFSVAGVTQKVRWIPAGKFLMGSPAAEKGRVEDEGAQHEVRLSGYWLADTACTQALWQAVMGENPARFKDDPRNPVEQVSWQDCWAFFRKLNERVPGLNAGFPSEAQWEYACRAGTTTAYSFGQKISQKQANFDYKRKKTVPVASLPSNPWGFYEMHGNVWEWCSDWFGPYSAEPSANPEGPPQGTGRVLRGGSWFYAAGYARSASRDLAIPGSRYGYIGLRVAPGRDGPAEPGRGARSAAETHARETRRNVAVSLARIAEGNGLRNPYLDKVASVLTGKGGADRVSWREQRAMLERKPRKSKE